MRRVRFYETGEPEVLKLEETPTPEPQTGEVRVRVRAIGLNRAEAAFRRGRYLEATKLPAGLGYEASGEVAALGPGVDGVRVGDAVSIVPSFSMNDYGVYGDETIVPVRALAPKPERLSWEEAASVWMQYLTAWGGLVACAGLGAGDAVIIPAASSSVGLAAIQVVNVLGGTSIAVTRTSAKREKLVRLGAAHVIASTEQSLVDEVRRITDGKGARIAFDPVAGSAVRELVEAAGREGIIVIYGRLSQGETPFPVGPALQKGLTFRGFLLFEIVRHAERFAEAKRFVFDGLENGTLTPVVAKTFPLDAVVDAHRYLESNEQIGKVVITVP